MTVYATAAAIMVGVYQYAEATWRELEIRYNAFTEQPALPAARVSMGQALYDRSHQGPGKRYTQRRL
jgi:hypothetical protein